MSVKVYSSLILHGQIAVRKCLFLPAEAQLSDPRMRSADVLSLAGRSWTGLAASCGTRLTLTVAGLRQRRGRDAAAVASIPPC